jgi:glycosyltransferase involved in cell wall biosynthesis
MFKYQFTVFTPCYNSSKTIHRIIESLKQQTFTDFEWIIVDDCSTDNLYEKIEPIIVGALFPVRYFRQEYNLGKPAAINWGVSKAEGEFFLIIDADDAFTPDALEVFYTTFQALPGNIKNCISGVTCNCRDQYGEFIGTSYPTNGEDPLICNVFDMRYKYKVKGEKWGFTKTDIMRLFPFNTAVDKNVTENTVWFAIADRYQAVFINRTLRIYYCNENPSSLTRIGRKKYPTGFVFYYQEILNKYMKKMYLSFPDTIRLYKDLIKYCLYAKIKIGIAIKGLTKFRKKMAAYVCVPLGYAALCLDKYREWRNKR